MVRCPKIYRRARAPRATYTHSCTRIATYLPCLIAWPGTSFPMLRYDGATQLRMMIFDNEEVSRMELDLQSSYTYAPRKSRMSMAIHNVISDFALKHGDGESICSKGISSEGFHTIKILIFMREVETRCLSRTSSPRLLLKRSSEELDISKTSTGANDWIQPNLPAFMRQGRGSGLGRGQLHVVPC